MISEIDKNQIAETYKVIDEKVFRPLADFLSGCDANYEALRPVVLRRLGRFIPRGVFPSISYIRGAIFEYHVQRSISQFAGGREDFAVPCVDSIKSLDGILVIEPRRYGRAMALGLDGSRRKPVAEFDALYEFLYGDQAYPVDFEASLHSGSYLFGGKITGRKLKVLSEVYRLPSWLCKVSPALSTQNQGLQIPEGFIFERRILIPPERFDLEGLTNELFDSLRKRKEIHGHS